MILTIVNTKGGVGKTTTAINLAAGLAARGKRTLLVDLDSAHAASLTFVGREALAPSIAKVLLDELPVAHAIRPTGVERLDLITGEPRLAMADTSLKGRGPEARLREALEPIRSIYGYIVVDTPPALSMLSVLAIVASDSYLVPITPRHLAVEGFANLRQTIKRLKSAYHINPMLLGYLFTAVDYRLRTMREVMAQVRRTFPQDILDTVIRTNVRLAEAPSFRETIFDYAPSSRGSEDYKALALEVISRCEKGEVANETQNR